jgi:hypothetical protein
MSASEFIILSQSVTETESNWYSCDAADAPEVVDQLIPIGHEAAAKELVGLFVERQGELGVLHQVPLRAKKNPPGLSMRGRGLAGVLITL